MHLTYCYRIKPTAEQIAIMEKWLELLRRHWNYALGQRLDWLNRTRSPIDRCSLISEPIGEIPEAVNYYTQQAALKETKRLFPEYKQIYAETQQVNLKRLNKAWDRWRKPVKRGKRGGRPRFKKPGDLRSFVFPRVNNSRAGAHLIDGVLKLSRIGSMPVVMGCISLLQLDQNSNKIPTVPRLPTLSKIPTLPTLPALPFFFTKMRCTRGDAPTDTGRFHIETMHYR